MHKKKSRGMKVFLILLGVLATVFIGFIIFVAVVAKDMFRDISEDELDMLDIVVLSETHKVGEPIGIEFVNNGVEGLFDAQLDVAYVGEDGKREYAPDLFMTNITLAEAYSKEEIMGIFPEVAEADLFWYTDENERVVSAPYGVFVPDKPGDYEIEAVLYYKSTSPSTAITQRITVKE